MESSGTIHIYQPFVLAAVSVLKEAAKISLSKKSVYTQYGKMSVGGTAVSIGVSGSICGSVVYDFSRDFTMRISSRMITDNQILTANPQEYRMVLESALQELSNMISGAVMSMVHDYYENIQITPPKIFLGKGYKLFERADKIIVIELTSSYGDFSINLNFTKNKGVSS